jgi:hypothetical protein
MALDPRVACAAPSCYLGGFRRHFARRLPADSEQNIYGQIPAGLDHADYVLMRAPQPTLICAVTLDNVDIAGTWEVFREAKRVYTRLGFSERVELVEADATHSYHKFHREATTRWMRRWLADRHEPIEEGELAIPDEKDLLCTPEGQVLPMAGGRSLFEVLADA